MNPNYNFWLQEGTTVEDPTLSKFIEFVPSQNKWKCLSGRHFTTSFNVSNHIKQKHLVGGEVGVDVEEEEEDEGAHLQPESETDDESGDDWIDLEILSSKMDVITSHRGGHTC